MTFPRRHVMVAAIEGIDTLLCSRDAAAVITAWNGTDWSKATAGLFVDLDQRQGAHPWEPFVGGGQVSLAILDDDFGKLTHRSTGAADTELVTALDRDDTTVVVKDASAFASSGLIYIGCETISYATKTTTDFQTCVRGKFHPIGTDSSGLGGIHFGHPHRVDTVSYAPPLGPRVTQFPTEWIGRWVALYCHGYEDDGTLQTRANATRLFAGRIAEVRDDDETGATIIAVDSALTALKEATIGGDQFSGTVTDGIYLKSGLYFSIGDWNGTTNKTGNDLRIISSGASGTNEANEGHYTTDQLHTILNTWLAGELVASRISGTYVFVIDQTELVTKIGWEIQGSGTVSYTMILPENVAKYMGYPSTVVQDNKKHDQWHSTPGTETPLRAWSPLFLVGSKLTIENLSGQFENQYDTIPANLKPTLEGTNGTGLFIFDDRFLMVANVTKGSDTIELSDMQVFWKFGNGTENSTPQAYTKTIDEDGAAALRQVFIFSGRATDILNQIAYSTGNGTAYNHDTYDVLSSGASLGWPGGLFGEAWETSVANLPAGDKPIALVLDKPTKLAEVIGSDLLMRFGFPVWRDGGLQMATWQTPSASLAVATLTEANKAEPSTTTAANHRTSTLLSARWRSNQFKVQYNRSILGESDYRSTAIIEDRTTIDDGGNSRSPRTIDARNTYSEFAGTGTGIEDIIVNTFIPTVTLFTKPIRTMRRSVNLDQAISLAPGDIIKVSDNFARDPDSGERGFSNRPAIVTSVNYSPGGNWPSSGDGPITNQIVGEVELMLTRGNRFFAYAPSAEIASYTSGTKTITCTAHAYSESSENADALGFGADDEVRVIEIDPDDPTSPQSWTDTIVSRSGNDLVLTTGLASYSSSKEYRIVPADYTDCQDSQQDKAFQADDADGMIQDEAQANTFGLAASSVAAVNSAHTDLPERHADLQIGDGKPFDAGSVLGLQKMVDNLIDHKTALSVPALGTTMSNSSYSSGSGFRTTLIMPIALTTAVLGNSTMRYASVSPWLRSSDGTTARVRITLSEKPPTDTTVDDMIIPTPLTQATWSTSSTTWAAGTAATLSLTVKDNNGWGWLTIECGYKAECKGVAKFVELERVDFS